MYIRGVLFTGIPRIILSALGGILLALPFAPSLALAAEKPVQKTPAAVIKAIKDESGGTLKKFYKARQYRPLWLRGSAIGPEATVLLGMIESADVDGLDPGDYEPEKLRIIVNEARSGTPKALARAEIFLSKQFTRFVDDMRRPGTVEMRYLDPQLQPKSRKADAVLRAASFTTSFPDYVTKLGWMNPQ